MKYFVTVSVLQSTTKLGRLLADLVVRRYGNALISYEEANQIPQYLEEEMTALCKENKRLKKCSYVRTGMWPEGFSSGRRLKYTCRPKPEKRHGPTTVRSPSSLCR